MTNAAGQDPAILGATQLAGLIRAKQVSSRELLAIYAERISRLNPTLNAVVALDLERAERTARELDDRAARDEWVGPLHGLPCTIKDSLDTEGIVTTAGSPALAERIPVRDAAAVARVKDAGAVIMGKTNLPLWSGDLQTAGALFGTATNPYDPSLNSGGSSGGAASAVAAGLTAFELGADLAGSIRVPSSFCGIAGHKPTYGLVPQRGHVTHPDGGVDLPDISVVGPMARRVEDLRLLMGVLAGPEHLDEGWSFRLPEPPDRPLRIAVHVEEPGLPVSDLVRTSVAEAAEALTADGHTVSWPGVPVPLLESFPTFLALSIAATSLQVGDESNVDRSMDSHTEWLRLDLARIALRERWLAWFDDYDALLLPAWPTTAGPTDPAPLAERRIDIDGRAEPIVPVSAWPATAGVIGFPSSVVRMGGTPEGLPVGVQVVASRHRDLSAIHTAERIEELLGGYRPPAVALSAEG